MAENQKKFKVAAGAGSGAGQGQVQGASQAAVPSFGAGVNTSGFKISVVDEHGMKNGEFSDISHLKFETAKGGKPKHLFNICHNL